jgi:hypothetical protein
MENFEIQFNRTLAAVRRLSEGEQIKLPTGHTIMMGEDMTIGYALEYPDGSFRISGMSTIDLKELNALLNEHFQNFPYLPVTRRELDIKPRPVRQDLLI